MSEFPRYAIYFVPAADSDLYRFGADLIGYDSFSARDCAVPAGLNGLFADWQDITADPRKYGFHATLKAPFPLLPARNEAELRAACATFAQQTRAVPQIAPVVNALGDFVAIVPSAPNAVLAGLANDCVTAFEPFRAPMSDADRARRNPDRLTPRQAEQLDRWGYPYVFEDFRFHMTLTGRLPAERRDAVLAELRDRFVRLQLPVIDIDRIALCRQVARPDRFTVLETYRLG